jgi:uncharacterized repeat protein (TIGR01451 family)
MSTSLKCIFLLLCWPVIAVAQLQISHPGTRFVVQRGANGNGQLYIAGRFTGLADRVEAQLTPVVAGQGTATGWQAVQVNPANNIFLGSITGTGGWYVLKVRTLLNNTVVEQTSVQPVGIGEVFVTAGQSNARGLGIGDNDLGTDTDRVNAIDSINHYYPPGNTPLVSSGDPSPVPRFKALTATKRVFPMAESSWAWGELGDYIVNRYNVPVAFYVTGWDGSTIENWYKTANGQSTCNRYNCTAGDWPNLQPYTNLRNVLQYYLSVAGVRSVLWQQGEAEYEFPGSTSIPPYADQLTNVIQKSRQDFGGRNLPWMVARASFDGSVTRQAVIDKQNQVINTPGLNVFPGPNNDAFTLRNAGSNDVHFRNSSRPSPNPQYYLNNNAIPPDMGLSTLARSWNNSLDNTFFQNAQPITPANFAITGNLSQYTLPGSTIAVSFATVGSFNGDNQWQVQLLDSLGQYLSVLGSGASSPIQVTLPGNRQSGRFQIRVVASSPALPAVPSNLFQITNQADVSLEMAIDQRIPDINTPVTVNLTVRNDGIGQATGVVVRDRLPPNLAFISSPDFSASGSVLTSSAITINVGEVKILSFIAQPTAAGTYQNAAEVAQETTTDSDSQPNSGTGDGQDDAAQVDFRTRQSSNSLFVSPNPNQVPLPPVASNQPAPDPNKADVSISLTVNTRTPSVNDVITYTLTVNNRGGLSATSLFVTAYLPAGQTFVPGDDFGPSGGNPVSGISSLAAGSSVSVRFRATITTAGYVVCNAQVTAVNEADPDSTPNNGTTNGEDDTAQVDLRAQ